MTCQVINGRGSFRVCWVRLLVSFQCDMSFCIRTTQIAGMRAVDSLVVAFQFFAVWCFSLGPAVSVRLSSDNHSKIVYCLETVFWKSCTVYTHWFQNRVLSTDSDSKIVCRLHTLIPESCTVYRQWFQNRVLSTHIDSKIVKCLQTLIPKSCTVYR